jgi:GMP synthase PP-ATPase subunit
MYAAISGDWKMSSLLNSLKAIRKRLATKKFCVHIGWRDSSVAAGMIQKAIGNSSHVFL